MNVSISPNQYQVELWLRKSSSLTVCFLLQTKQTGGGAAVLGTVYWRSPSSHRLAVQSGTTAGRGPARPWRHRPSPQPDWQPQGKKKKRVREKWCHPNVVWVFIEKHSLFLSSLILSHHKRRKRTQTTEGLDWHLNTKDQHCWSFNGNPRSFDVLCPTKMSRRRLS